PPPSVSAPTFEPAPGNGDDGFNGDSWGFNGASVQPWLSPSETVVDGCATAVDGLSTVVAPTPQPSFPFASTVVDAASTLVDRLRTQPSSHRPSFGRLACLMRPALRRMPSCFETAWRDCPVSSASVEVD